MNNVKLRVTNTSTFVDAYIGRENYQEFKKALGYIPPNAKFLIKNSKFETDGNVTTVCWNMAKCKCAIKKDGTHFPTGLLPRAREFFEKKNIPVEIIDQREKVSRVFDYKPSATKTLRDYQKISSIKGMREQRGILEMATGGGKTVTCADIICRLGIAPFIFYVTSIDLLEQAYRDLTEYITLNGEKVEVGRIGGGYCDIRDINIMTAQTAVRAIGYEYKKIDDESSDIKDNEEVKKRYDDIKKLIYESKGYIADECISGDSKILTDLGRIRVDKIEEFKPRYILSYSEKYKELAWKKILKFWKKGEKETFTVNTSSRSITCTDDHLLYVNGKWIETKDVKIGDELLLYKSGYFFAEPEKVTSILKDKKQEVYDIEVDETHCFFANDILVHNCHHWASETCQIISDYSANAKYRYGASATPERDLEDDILIEACFGRKICQINASFLIKQGYLIKPKIYIVPIKNSRFTKGDTYSTCYKKAIVENADRNRCISDMATKMYSEGRKILILVKQIEHGKMLESLIPNSIFLHGSSGKDKRKESIEKARNAGDKIIIASTIFDEGVDIPRMDTLILAGSGKSSTRALQRIGRVLRKHQDKKDAIIIDFNDLCKYMNKHSAKRIEIYSREPEFDIEYL